MSTASLPDLVCRVPSQAIEASITRFAEARAETIRAGMPPPNVRATPSVIGLRHRVSSLFGGEFLAAHASRQSERTAEQSWIGRASMRMRSMTGASRSSVQYPAVAETSARAEGATPA